MLILQRLFRLACVRMEEEHRRLLNLRILLQVEQPAMQLGAVPATRFMALTEW